MSEYINDLKEASSSKKPQLLAEDWEGAASGPWTQGSCSSKPLLCAETWNMWGRPKCLPYHLPPSVPSLDSEPLSPGTVVEGKVEAQRALTSNLGSVPSGCVTVDRLLPFSEPQVKNEHHACFPSEYETRWMHLARCLERVVGV